MFSRINRRVAVHFSIIVLMALATVVLMGTLLGKIGGGEPWRLACAFFGFLTMVTFCFNHLSVLTTGRTRS